MYNKLLAIQQELRVPKNRLNKFGGYHYRSCEDIVEAVKPLCAKHKLTLTLSDEVKEVGERVFVQALARLSDDGEGFMAATGWAEIAPDKKGMDVAQITGAASSYARKYALNGLFAIDDTADADATNTHGKEETDAPDIKDYCHKLKVCTTLDNLRKAWETFPADVKADAEVVAMKEEMKKKLSS